MTTRRTKRARVPWVRVGLPLLAGLAVLGGTAWYYWSGTIYYSLFRIRQAVKYHDRYLFERHVDLEHLSRRIVDDYLDAAIDEVAKERLGPLEQMGANLGVSITQLITPRLAEEVQYAVIRGVETGALNRGDLKMGHGHSNDPFGGMMAEFRNEFPKLKPLGKGTIRVHGSSAMVELPLQLNLGLSGASSKVRLHVRFIRTPDRYWRASDIENFKEILTAWRDGQKQRLALANQPIQKEINEAVTVVKTTKEQGLDDFGTSKDAWVVVTLKNTSEQAIKGLLAEVTVSEQDGGQLKVAQFQDMDPIPAGESREKVWPLDLDLADEVDRAIYDLDVSKLSFTVVISHLLFADGRSLQIAESLEEAETAGQETPAPAPVVASGGTI